MRSCDRSSRYNRMIFIVSRNEMQISSLAAAGNGGNPMHRPRFPARHKSALWCVAMGGALSVVLFAAAIPGTGAPSAKAAPSSGIVFDGSPGTGAPPSTLGPYTMQAFGADSQATGADVSGVAGPTGMITFDPALEHDVVGDGWATWSNGYTGDVYATGEAETATVALPAGTGAFYLYAEPDQFMPFSVTATSQDGTSSGPVTVNGQSGAAYFGFYGTSGTTISTITVTTAGDDFAIGEFGIAKSSTSVAAIRFAPVADQANPTAPGLPVVKDDGQAPVMDHELPSTCPDGLADPQSYDYLDCTTPPSGTPSKDWPVIYVAGSTLTINQAVFFSQSALADPQLTATATIGGQTLTLAPAALTSTSVNGAYELSAANLTFQGTMPAKPGVDTLSITWTITSGGTPAGGGTSTHQIYVTAAPYVQPKGTPDTNVLPYVSLLDVGTRAAATATGATPRDVFNAIWTAFTTRNIAHPILNPATGMTTRGPDFTYYSDGYSSIGSWWNIPLTTCPSFEGFLAASSGHCGNWAEMLTYVLAYQGISSTYVGLQVARGSILEFYPGFNPGPKPNLYFSYMLVGPGLWHFSSPTASDPYPYEDPITVKDDMMAVGGTEVSYQASGTPIAQGQIKTPPELFIDGDHAIVQTPWGWVDPSYGNPASTNPYPSLTGTGGYEQTAIAGFATIYYDDFGRWVPAQWMIGQQLIDFCTTHQCEFRATPYTPSRT